MDKYKISQAGIKKRIPKPIKAIWHSKRQVKTIDPKLMIGIVGGAIGIIVLGLLVSIFIVGGHKGANSKLPPHASSTSSSSSAGIPSAAYNALTNGVTNKNLSILGSYCTAKIHIIIVKSGVDETLNCSDAAKLINGGISGATNPWNFHVPESDISAWQTGAYGQYFSGTAIVGESANGDVISIIFNNSGQVTTVIVAPANSLTPTDSSTGSSTSSGSSSGSSTSPTNNSSTSGPDYIPPGNPTPTGGLD